MDQRILIVDDEDAFGEIAELILSRAGFAVIRARSAEEALKAIPETHPDIILSDVEMPGQDGFDLLRIVRQDPVYKDMPFALMSARRTFPPDRVKGLSLGSDDYIAKPFSGDELVARVKTILRRSGKKVPEAPAGIDAAPAIPADNKKLTEYLEKISAPKSGAIPPAQTPTGPAPAAPPVLQELRRRVTAKEPTAMVLADLTYFRGYNECLGFDRGDEVLQFTWSCFEAANKDAADGEALASPLYADEFVALMTPDKAIPFVQSVLHHFSQGILGFYPPADLERGFIESKNRQGRMVAYPFLNLVAAVASNTYRKLTHPGQFIHVGRELLAYAKSLGGTRYVIDRRKEPIGPAPLSK